MNKRQASKAWVGQKVRLQPPARRSGVIVHDDWLVVALDDESVTLERAEMAVAVIGFDGIRAYFSEQSRNTPTQKYGWLQLLVQVDVSPDGKVSSTPLPLQALTSPVVNPLQTDAGKLAVQRYRSLWTAARAAVAYLLFAGASTEQQVFAALAPIGYVRLLVERGEQHAASKLTGPKVDKSATRQPSAKSSESPLTATEAIRSVSTRLHDA